MSEKTPSPPSVRPLRRELPSITADQITAIVVTHYSNYKIIGFTSRPAMSELAEPARKHDILLLFDQGSRNFLDVSHFGLAAETRSSAGFRTAGYWLTQEQCCRIK